jgi:hypothetical protein
MPKSISILAIGVVATLAAACDDPAASGFPSDDYVLPAPDQSLDPGRLSVGDLIATPCAFGMYGNRLDHLRGRHEWATVDIYFGGSPDGPGDGPSSNDVALVSAHGGRVLYHFTVPAVRARVVLSQIPHIVRAGDWITVREVPDPTRYDVPSLLVGFERPVQDSDVELYITLGGQVDYRFVIINAVSGVLPDRSIPGLRDWSDVEYVEAGGVGCLG